MTLKEMVIPNKDFQTSINIDFDFGSKAKIEGLIPTDSVCRCLEEIVKDVVLPSNQRSKLLVGAYGKGKSHVVLAALTAMWVKDASCFRRIIEAYKKRGLGFGDTLKQFVTGGKRLLPVVISGSTSDLRHSLLRSLRNALQLSQLEGLMPSTNYDGAIRVLERWKEDYPDTLSRFEEITGNSAASVISRLRNMDTSAYNLFAEAYPTLTSGSTFDALDGAEVIAVYEHVLRALDQHGIDGIYVVYDEFSKYLETSLDRATLEDTKLLQDFAEACNHSGSERQLHLLLISHKSLSNYIDANLPKEKVDGWRGVSGRFREIEMTDDANQYYELLSNAIIKDDDLWSSWLSERGGRNKRQLKQIGERYVSQGLFDTDAVETVAFGCFPLHPLTTYLLSRMSEKVAQNERTLFTFICSSEENSLGHSLAKGDAFVAPDCVYSYFEPLLRKEYYTSPLHKTYELARASMQRVESDSLECRIIKTIAAIDIVAQYDRLAPTRQTVIDLYTDCGFEPFEIDAALDNLVENDSIVYLRRSNAFLRLKETSGVRIDSEISDRAESLRSVLSPEDILNEAVAGRALYPSRYNEERGIVRYFDCGFASSKTIRGLQRGARVLDGSGDGEVIAIYTESSDDLDATKLYAKEVLSSKPMTVVVFPRKHVDIADALYKLEAARQLKAEAADDSVLSEEYEIVIEDYSEIVDDYIAGFFQPELGRSLYFVGCIRRNVVTRKRRLSEELSRLSDHTFRDTPRITSEALNKNELTGTAFSSRTKILKALCARSLEPNFGFVGNGQETSMARSAFEKTGLIADLAISAEESEGEHARGIDKVLKIIRDFIENAQDAPFSVVYDDLTGPSLGIGMRRGPIPLYLAYVLRNYRDEVKITKNGEERTLNETLFDDISRQPEAYRLTRLRWSSQMAGYVHGLARTFGCSDTTASRNEVAEAIRQWYVELPQITRNSKTDHSQTALGEPISARRAAFFRAIRRIEIDSDRLLFDELPKAFGSPSDYDATVSAVKAEKLSCDRYLADVTDSLVAELVRTFDENAHEEASLGSVLRDWLDDNPSAETHVFSGVNNLVLSAIKAANGDDRVTIARIAKAATSLRIDDWNDSRFADFFNVIAGLKAEVEGVGRESSAKGTRLGIVFADDDGAVIEKTFDAVACSGRARLLKNSILSCLDEMGGSLRPEEKRQVVFEVLEGLCR